MFGNKKNDFESKKGDCLFFFGMLAIGAIAIIVYLMVTGNTPQTFQDVVIEYTALDGSNKSAERILFYIFSLLGVAVYAVYYFWSRRAVGTDVRLSEDSKEENPCLYVVLGLLICVAVRYFVYSDVNWLLMAGMMMAMVLCMKDKSLIIPGTSFLFLLSYAICALYRLYVLVGGGRSLNMMTVVLLGVLSSVLLLALGRADKRRLFIRGILIAQLLIPFSMLTYLASKYKYGGEFISIHIPYRVQILIWVIIILFVMEAILKLRKKWNPADDVGEALTYGTCIAIMSFNRYSGSGSVVSTDLHHPFENIIGFSQIFELGQKAFSEYIPVSGMYSVVQGFFLSFFGNGEFSFYYLTENIFYLSIIVMIVVLLKKQIKGEWVLLISLIFRVIYYNRVVFILPIMLLLVWPKLIEKKNLWLKTWFLSSFLHGLYYPVFGAATCIGFMPLGIWQIITYARSGVLKKDVRKVSFWSYWFLCCIPVGIGFPALPGTIKQMKAMGGQTVYADGITRFGQLIPDDFFPYIQFMQIRLILYYLFSYLIVISLVWISAVLCFRLGNIRIEKKRIKTGSPVPALVSLSFGIALLVTFSYTVIRMDIDSIYARSAGMVFVAAIMMILIMERYIRGRGTRFLVYGLAIFVIVAVRAEGFGSMEADSKLMAFYTVPDNYVHVVGDQIRRFGECFADQGFYHQIESGYNTAATRDKNSSYFGVGDFGIYYMCDIKGDSVMEIAATVKGYDAAQETVDLIRSNGTIVGSVFDSIGNYYFYYWLIHSGEYVWVPDKRLFVPNDGSVTLEDVRAGNQYIDVSAEGAALGRTPGSWGKSMDTMYDIFSDAEVNTDWDNFGKSVNVQFWQEVNGSDADFMYLEFVGQDQDYQYTLFGHGRGTLVQNDDGYQRLMKKDYNRDVVVTLSWTDESGTPHSMNCRMDQGRLLIPLGGGRGWLLNKHSNIVISVMHGTEIVEVPEIRKIEMLKLREVQ